MLDAACCICTERYTNINIRDNPVAVAPCGHTFHAQCVLRWMRMKTKNTCPQCRQKVTKKQIIHPIYFQEGRFVVSKEMNELIFALCLAGWDDDGAAESTSKSSAQQVTELQSQNVELNIENRELREAISRHEIAEKVKRIVFLW